MRSKKAIIKRVLGKIQGYGASYEIKKEAVEDTPFKSSCSTKKLFSEGHWSLKCNKKQIERSPKCPTGNDN